MHDTSPEAAALQIAAFRQMSPAERVALAFEASDWLQRIAAARPLTSPAPSATPAVAEPAPDRVPVP